MKVKSDLAPVTGRPASFYRKHALPELDYFVCEQIKKICDSFSTDLTPVDAFQIATEISEDYYYWTLPDFVTFAKLAAKGKLKRQIDYVQYGDVKFKLTKPLIFEMAHVYDLDRQGKIDMSRTKLPKSAEQLREEKQQEMKLAQLYQDIKDGKREAPEIRPDNKKELEDKFNKAKYDNERAKGYQSPLNLEAYNAYMDGLRLCKTDQEREQFSNEFKLKYKS